MENDKITCKVTNVFLRQSLIDLCRKNNYKIDSLSSNKIIIDDPFTQPYFWLNDILNMGAGFSGPRFSGPSAIPIITIDEMFEFISAPNIIPIQFTLKCGNAIVNNDGSVTIEGSHEMYESIIDALNKVIKKSI
jgi:hypothetical protein